MPDKKPYPYETATAEQKKIGSFWWCIHHDTRLENLSEPVAARVAFILSNKERDEHETRLRNIVPVLHPENLPPEVPQAWQAFVTVWQAYKEAPTGVKYHEAWDTHDRAKKVVQTHDQALAKQHNAEYPNNTWEDGSIFG